jgi:tetratricopeptide (TPR) repeat protein
MGHYRKALAMAEEANRQDPRSAQSRYDLAIGHTKVGRLLIDADPVQADLHLEQALKLYAGLAAADPKNIAYLRNQVFTLARRAQAHTRAGRRDSAQRSLLQAQELSSKLMQSRPKDGDVLHESSGLLLEVARFQMANGNYTGAVDTVRQAITNRTPAVADGRDSLHLIDADSQDKELLARAYEGIGSPAALQEACRAWKLSDSIWNEWSQKGIASSYSRRRSEEVSRSLQHCEQRLTARLKSPGKKN